VIALLGWMYIFATSGWIYVGFGLLTLAAGVAVFKFSSNRGAAPAET